MPVIIHVDHERRRVVGTATGTLEDRDLFTYQEKAGRYEGYDEIFDGTAVERLQDIHPATLMKLAGVAAATDTEKPAKLAIVATQDVHFGMGRMYESFRECAPNASRKLGIFHSREEAEQWLDANEE